MSLSTEGKGVGLFLPSLKNPLYMVRKAGQGRGGGGGIHHEPPLDLPHDFSIVLTWAFVSSLSTAVFLTPFETTDIWLGL